MAEGVSPAPFIPDSRRANCTVNEADLAQLLHDDDADPAAALPISLADQAKFADYDYRTKVNDATTGRTERVPVRSPSWMATRQASEPSGGPESTRNATVTGYLPSDATSVGSGGSAGGSTMNYAVQSLRYARGGSGVVHDGGRNSPSLGGGQQLRGVLAGGSPAVAGTTKTAVAVDQGRLSTFEPVAGGSSIIFQQSARSTRGNSVSAALESTWRIPPVVPSETPPGGVPMHPPDTMTAFRGSARGGGTSAKVLAGGSSSASLAPRRTPALRGSTVAEGASSGPGVGLQLDLGLQEFPAMRIGDGGGGGGGDGCDADLLAPPSLSTQRMGGAVARESARVPYAVVAAGSSPRDSAMGTGRRRSSGSVASESSLRCAAADGQAVAGDGLHDRRL